MIITRSPDGACTVLNHPTDRDWPAIPDRDQAAAARLAWEVAVDQLVQPGQARITRADGATEFAQVLCLLDQVAEAVMPGNEHTTTAGGTGSRPPACLTALALLGEIRDEVRRCCHEHEHPHPDAVAAQVRLWIGHAESWQHLYPDYVVWAAHMTNDWVRRARMLLDPPPRYTLRGRACPICGIDTVQVWSDDEGDYVRRPALTIDPDKGEAVCGDCGQVWPLDVWVQLAATLDRQHQHDTLTVPSGSSTVTDQHP